MRDKDGGIVAVEVKSHRLNDRPKVTADMDDFVRTRLESAAEPEGHWKNVDPKTRENALKFLEEINIKKSPVRGIIVNVDYALAQYPRERYFEWAKGLGAEIFDDDF